PILLKPLCEMRQSNFSVRDLRMPLLFPLERNEAIIFEAFQIGFQFKQGKIALASRHMFPFISFTPQILDVNMANGSLQQCSAFRRSLLMRRETVRGVPNNANVC